MDDIKEISGLIMAGTRRARAKKKIIRVLWFLPFKSRSVNNLNINLPFKSGPTCHGLKI